MNGAAVPVAAICSFAALALLFGTLFGGGTKAGSAKQIERRLKLYSIGATGKRTRTRGVLAESPVARRAVDLVDKIPRSAKRERSLLLELERAGWPLRPAEFAVIRVASGLGAGVVTAVLTGRWLLGIVLGGIGYAAPRLALKRTTSRRTSAFLAQLPDTLQLIAGSLQAGYGLVQAVDSLVKESKPPTSVEFSRVLTETRLGMTLEESLHAMADRIGSDDFRWVVMAISIQRQIGGNLAALLHTVAATLREREGVRRQIKVLSAEGRMSASILIILPFAIAGYVATVNPQFLKILTGDPVGRYMIGGAIVLMGLGVLWMRKIIRIDV